MPTQITPIQAVVKPTTVCLCGSTAFEKDFADAKASEEASGRVVLTLDTFSCEVEKSSHTESRIQALKDAHLPKIAHSDEILVINGTKNGTADHVGQSTMQEIDYAILLRKTVRFYFKPNTAVVSNVVGG